MNETLKHLLFLNQEFRNLYRNYEGSFWIVYTKDSDESDDLAMQSAMADLIDFKSNKNYLYKTIALLETSSDKEKERLLKWRYFFEKNSVPATVLSLRTKISKLESRIGTMLKTRVEGYVDPHSELFIHSKRVEMITGMKTDPRPEYRKVYFNALEKLALTCINEYVELVALRNNYAQELGFKNFYDYKVQFDDRSTMGELFGVLENIFDKTQHKFSEIRELEIGQTGLREPWNFHYMMTGSLEDSEDEYFQLENALGYWIRMMNGLGVDYQGATLRLDLLARKGKYDNGFCHIPQMSYLDKDDNFITGETNFTCNAIPGQIGSGFKAFVTLVHEGGHAAHFVNMKQKESFYNNEYEATTSLDETQSMLLDSLCISPEWLVMYAKDKQGNSYSLKNYEERLRSTQLVNSLEMIELMRIPFFEKDVYQEKNLDAEKVKKFAIDNYHKCYDHSVDSLEILLKPHIYNFDSACQYHNYELAMIALEQWKNYFYKKHGSIVDNSKIGPEMEKIWNFAGSISFSEMINIATGEGLNPEAYISSVNKSIDEKMNLAKERIRLSQKNPKGKLEINAKIELWHGNAFICDNSKSCEDMISSYYRFLEDQKSK